MNASLIYNNNNKNERIESSILAEMNSTDFEKRKRERERERESAYSKKKKKCL